jgi:hypothetical protein
MGSELNNNVKGLGVFFPGKIEYQVSGMGKSCILGLF